MVGRVVVGVAAAALGAGVLVVALVLGLVAAHGATYCTTVGYLNLAPLVVEAPDDVDAVAACIGDGCTPVALPAADPSGAGGAWTLPQEPPYLTDGTRAGAVAEITVLAEAGERVVVDAVVPVTRVARGEPNRCAGPFDYAPVRLPDTLAAR